MKVVLNLSKKDNYAFFDEDSKVNLSISAPVAEVLDITPAIKRGLHFGTLYLIQDKAEADKITETLKDTIIEAKEEEVAIVEEVKTEVKDIVEKDNSQKKNKGRGGK